MKEGEREMKKRSNPILCGGGEGKRGLFDEKMNDFIDVLSLI
jgi:hypothetical protein